VGKSDMDQPGDRCLSFKLVVEARLGGRKIQAKPMSQSPSCATFEK